MEALRRRTPEQVASLAEELRHELAARLLPAPALPPLLERFKFRDLHGDAWTLGPLTKTWYLHRLGRWIASPTAPVDALDGPADLELPENIGAGAGPDDGAPEKKKPAGRDADPATYFQEAVDRVAKAFEAGSINSVVAEARLQDLYAVDARGTIWMLGVQSRGWYTYSPYGWQRSSQSLDRQALAGEPAEAASMFCSSCRQPLAPGARFCANCGTPVSQGARGTAPEISNDDIRSFLDRSANLIPESIVAPWNPPIGYPEQVTACPHCDAPNIGEVEACITCERPLRKDPKVASAPAAATPAAAGDAAPQAEPRAQPAPPFSAPFEAIPSIEASQPAQRGNRTMWFVGGCFVTIACAALAAATIIGLGLLWDSL
jgi:hypothetical protein